MQNEAFKKDLENLINKHSVENEVDMPDFVLAEMIVGFIGNVGSSVKKRDRLMGHPEEKSNVIS